MTGATDHTIDTGHAIASVTAGGGEIMVAVVPTIEESVAQLQGDGPDDRDVGVPHGPTLPGPGHELDVRGPHRRATSPAPACELPRQARPGRLDAPARGRQPRCRRSARTGGPTPSRSSDGFVFSPPSNEPVTAETFRATFERAALAASSTTPPPGRRASSATSSASTTTEPARRTTWPGWQSPGDPLTITLVTPAPDLLDRLAAAVLLPGARSNARSPEWRTTRPAGDGAGPYYLAAARRRSSSAAAHRAQEEPELPRDPPAAVRQHRDPDQSATAVSIGRVRTGDLDATMLAGGEPISSGTGPIAAEWGPGSRHAAGGDQRWFGAPLGGTHFLMLNTARPTFRDLDVRRAVALALDRAAVGAIQVVTPSGALLTPAVPGGPDATAAAPTPDLEAARALMDGRTPRSR